MAFAAFRRPVSGSANFALVDDAGVCVIKPSGDWTVLELGDAGARLKAELTGHNEQRRFDAHDLGRIDTAGTFALMQNLVTGDQPRMAADLAGREELRRLAELVEPSLVGEPAPRRSARSLHDLFDRIGRAMASLGHEIWQGQVFAGRMIVALGRALASPRQLRPLPLVATMEQAGLNAVPIVMAMTFFIGAILALVGSTMLTTLGVKVYAVELVGVGVLREFGAVIAAILFAGRSASAFAAQLGSMRMSQEIDAMQVMGIDIFDALVVPRVVAALIMLPLLTVCGDISGMLGGMIVAAFTMDISPAFFFQRMTESVGVIHFWVGMSKTPFFALIVAAVGCRQGLAASGDVESLGRHVTAAVVQSIFLIIMFDAMFALIYQRVGQ